MYSQENIYLKNNPFYKCFNHNNPSGFDVPDVSMFGMLEISAKSHPKAKAYEYYGTYSTYEKLIENIEFVSNSFYGLGVRKGDVVTILCPNMPETVMAIYALNRIGAISNIVHPLSAQEEIRDYLVSCKCKYIVTVDLCVDKISGIIDSTPLQRVIIVSPSQSMGYVMKKAYNILNKTDIPQWDSRYILWKRFLHIKGEAEEYTPSGKENHLPAIILHSGGTTGTPKDIMLSNSNFNSFAVQSVLTLDDVGVGDKILAVLPVFHGFGLGVCIHDAFCFGACSVLVPRFSAKSFLRLINRYKPTMIFGVPTLFEAIVKSNTRRNSDLSFLKYIVCGGDSLSKDLEMQVNRFLREHNCSTHICEGYGMTEGLAALSLSVGEGFKSGTVGKPLIGNSMCITEPGTVNVLPQGIEGELCVSGPTVMIGYRNNDIETAAVLKRHKDGKLWLHTGDIALIDTDGFVHYKFRLKRMIISSGYNVYPSRIEKVIEDLPEVSKCTVVGIQHPYKKEVAKAFIVLEKGYSQSNYLTDKIKSHCKKNLSHYSVPYEYEFIKEFPKTPYGKTDFCKLQAESNKASQG